jgi:hypothetical protein
VGNGVGPFPSRVESSAESASPDDTSARVCTRDSDSSESDGRPAAATPATVKTKPASTKRIMSVVE